MPIFQDAPIQHKRIMCEPLLEPAYLEPYLGNGVLSVIAGGESGKEARFCSYTWFLNLRNQCIKFGIPFYFKQTGARFLKDGKIYRIARRYQYVQARKAAIEYLPELADR